MSMSHHHSHSPQQASGQGFWTEHFSPEGRRYFYNMKLDISYWGGPPITNSLKRKFEDTSSSHTAGSSKVPRLDDYNPSSVPILPTPTTTYDPYNYSNMGTSAVPSAAYSAPLLSSYHHSSLPTGNAASIPQPPSYTVTGPVSTAPSQASVDDSTMSIQERAAAAMRAKALKAKKSGSDKTSTNESENSSYLRSVKELEVMDPNSGGTGGRWLVR